MNSVSNTIQKFRTATRFAADVAVWSGNSMIRRVNAGVGGVCLVCNNLQPYGHENTWGRAGASWMEKVSDHDGLYALNITRNADITTLVLEDIAPKKILETRKTDERTGLPKRKCRYCRLLCDIFDVFFIDEYMSWITETHNGMPIQFGLMIREGLPLIINCWSFTYDKHILSPRVDLEVYCDLALDDITSLAEISNMGSVGIRAENAGSEACTKFMKECVIHCCSEHETCCQEAANFVPTRLIYLGESNHDLQICEFEATIEGVAWAALSHCWGEGQPYKLEQANLHSLKQHIDSAHLPATFLDAIEVARKLDLLYLWIDSLCIIQGNTGDWEIEAARMGMVYGQAFVVICAASSPNPNTSFLGPRDNEWLPKRFQFETDVGTKIPIMVRQRSLLAASPLQGSYEPPFTSSWASLKRVGPLYKRGWCFQETFLATRVIHFAPGSIIFECKTHRRSEDQLPPFPSTIPGTLGQVDPAEQWRMLVKAYTQRQLSFASDKLPAIGGAASTMPQAKRSAYLAGLWRESLLLDLLWQVMPGGLHRALTYPAAEQTAPSWSWASIDRGVTWNPLKSPQPVAELLSAEAPVLGRNPYGAVASGRIRIRGRVKHCRISTDGHRNEQWVHYMTKDDESKKIHFRMDGLLMPVSVPGETETFARRARADESIREMRASALFLCVAKTPWMNYNYVGLILSKSADEPGCMERVGNITGVPSDWYDSGEVATVTII